MADSFSLGPLSPLRSEQSATPLEAKILGTATEFPLRGPWEGSEVCHFRRSTSTSHLTGTPVTCTALGTYFVLYCTTSASECVFGTLRSRAIQFCTVQMHSTYWGLSSVLRKALFHTVIIQIAGTVEMGHFAHLRVTTYKIHILPYKNHIQILKIRNYPGS